MKCPVCSEEMEIVKKDISDNFKNGQKYNRVIYHCKRDDVWINLEIPIKEEVV